MSENGTTAKVARLPKCDFCDEVAVYDGKTVMGPWAYMCSTDFDKYGPHQLGTGWAQRLVVAA